MAIPKSIKPNTGIKGLDIVLSNLNKEIKAIEGRSMQGLIRAAIILRADMDTTPPLIPIDTGNLRSSWFTTNFRQGTMFGLTMGFSANYAVFVHEMVDKGSKVINWSRPDSGPKFFEASLKRNKERILQEIADNATIK